MAVGTDRDLVGAAFDPAYRRAAADAISDRLGQSLDVLVRAAADRLPLRPSAQLKLAVIVEELGEVGERELPDRRRVGRPNGGDLGGDRALDEPLRVATVAQELADARAVVASDQRTHVAVEAQLVANQPPEPRSQQVRALREQAPGGVGELEGAVAGRHRHPHLGWLGGDAELVEERRRAAGSCDRCGR